MNWRMTGLGVVVLASIPAASVAADQKYVIHEKLHAGQKVTCSMTQTTRYHITTTSKGSPPDKVEQSATEDWKVTVTTLAEKDGSATKASVEVADDSVDKTKDAGEAEQSNPCPYAGKTITLTRNPDETITNDFKSDKPIDDEPLLNSVLTPDSDYYPDHPVAIGQTWDVSPNTKQHSGLGPKDKSEGKCRLDWVKTINGKQYAHVSCSTATIQEEEGNVEEITECTGTMLVDLAAGMIVEADQTGKSTYTTDPHAATQVTGGTEFTYRMRTDGAPAAASTRP